jgi:diphosphomevalonate decarboxylase
MNTLSAKWRSPSNIALVKYWGKYEPQIPANPSISFTLSKSYTETELRLVAKKAAEAPIRVWLDGVETPSFVKKIAQFLARLREEVAFLDDYALEIRTHNSFPHSSGIASSASGMSALALCLLSLKESITGEKAADFYSEASVWARLGSGSASRSLYGPLAQWGKFKGLAESSDEYAIAYDQVAPVFKDFCDYILLVEKGQKAVSSTAGHGLMNGHPYAKARFAQAHQNLEKLLGFMKEGDMPAFGELVESEALTLHAMMLSSSPSFILMKPNTLEILERIRNFRRESGLAVYFTLDAGANVHLLFPKAHEPEVNQWVRDKVRPYLKNGEYICDQVGLGPQNLTL